MWPILRGCGERGIEGFGGEGEQVDGLLGFGVVEVDICDGLLSEAANLVKTAVRQQFARVLIDGGYSVSWNHGGRCTRSCLGGG